ncbi:serine/threonine-protein kinase-like protein CCR2 [Camellia sinensis]|uniref:serine/threonine-protein kinase-like protein CCR2 n=1 Tax=Camellia sinensis TaxID=4442 RepID=UPI001036BA17|nr:serine/threonine-protein kinase-like protein CCR2 [Camellia sinensis]
MNPQPCPSPLHLLLLLLLLLLLPPFMSIPAFGFGLTGPIAATFGDNEFFCAIDAAGNQEIICWQNNNNNKSTTSSSSLYFDSLPPMASLSGGEGFMCGISSNTSQAYCWQLSNPGTDLVPPVFKYFSYSQIAAGSSHVCAIRGSYNSTIGYGTVDCWEFSETPYDSSNSALFPVNGSSFHDPSVNNLTFKSIVSGGNFSCGVVKDGGVVCWGPKPGDLGVSAEFGDFETLASGRGSICGISSLSGEVKCWGDANEFGVPPTGIQFVALSASARQFCGIRKDDHGIECWGSIDDDSSVPKGPGFTAIASSEFTTCGVREVDLVLDCWGASGQSQSPLDFSPPLQLCSPGVCLPGSCPNGSFAFNASLLHEPELTSLCVQKDLNICLPCGSNCSQGFFPSSMCSKNADRICTDCSLCQNSSCWVVCGFPSSSEFQEIKKPIVILGSCVLGFILVVSGWCLIPRLIKSKTERRDKTRGTSCLRKPVVEAEPDPSMPQPVSVTMCIGTAQVFRLSELKDATNGFKEFNELGRGSYGFVYKATLSDGSQVAVKRANAATIIHTNNRDFEAEVEILCNIRHNNIVNLLGYCAEMGERLLVYEFMPHGTLHDHLHGELSPLVWNLRLKISLQIVKGLEYLHKIANPPIVHRDVKTSNILLDSNWDARISDFGVLSVNDRDFNEGMVNDVYNFGIVLLEILSGRKAHDRDYSPPCIIEWALPLIRHGKAAAIIDVNVALLKNVEPLLKLSEIAELALKENPSERPVMSDLVVWLDQIVKSDWL